MNTWKWASLWSFQKKIYYLWTAVTSPWLLLVSRDGIRESCSWWLGFADEGLGHNRSCMCRLVECPLQTIWWTVAVLPYTVTHSSDDSTLPPVERDDNRSQGCGTCHFFSWVSCTLIFCVSCCVYNSTLYSNVSNRDWSTVIVLAYTNFSCNDDLKCHWNLKCETQTFSHYFSPVPCLNGLSIRVSVKMVLKLKAK